MYGDYYRAKNRSLICNTNGRRLAGRKSGSAVKSMKIDRREKQQAARKVFAVYDVYILCTLLKSIPIRTRLFLTRRILIERIYVFILFFVVTISVNSRYIYASPFTSKAKEMESA